MKLVRMIASLAVLLVGWSALTSFAAQSGPKTLAGADKLYAEKSYAQAAKKYERALTQGIPARRQDEVRYRIAVSLGKSQQWDRAHNVGLDFVKQRRGTVWEARGLYWLGRLYIGIPHNGVRMGSRFFRGNNVPKAAANASPEVVYVQQQDLLNARDALEAARWVYPRFRREYHTEAEEIALDYDLIKILPQDPRAGEWQSEPLKWRSPSDPFWSFEALQNYDAEWPAPKKALFLFQQIRSLARTDRERVTELLAEAVWLRDYHALMRTIAVRYENEQRIAVPYPYQDMKPEPVLRLVISRYPASSLRDRAHILLAQWLTEDGRMNEAIREYSALIAAWPKSPWVSDARAAIAGILRKTVQVYPTEEVGKQKLTVQFRNLSQLHFRMWRVDLLRAVIAKGSRTTSGQPQLAAFGDTFGTLAQARKYLGSPVAEWDRAVTDNASRRTHTETLALPDRGPGAYFVEASGPSVKSATVVLVSDLAVVAKTHRDGLLLFTCSRSTGAPIPNAEIVVKRTWQFKNKSHASLERTVSGRDGLITVARKRPPGTGQYSIAAIARSGGSYAITHNADVYWGTGEEAAGHYRSYCTTDRSVYRPRQTVFYRELVFRRALTGLKPAAGQNVQIRVTNPEGQTVHQRTARTGEFGSVNGKFDLPVGAPLGEYAVSVGIEAVPGKPDTTSYFSEAGGNRFRVEEYKKPEFEVSVTPGTERVKLGQPVVAKIKATYYFGGGLPNAKVTYRVHRTPYVQTYQFPQPYDFLWRYSNEGDYDTSYRSGAVIQQGTLRTDANGEAKLEVKDVLPSPPGRGAVGEGAVAEGEGAVAEDQAFYIEADVQDFSRRTITGTGMVKATKHDVAVFLNYPHGYATQGDRVDVEIMTLNPSDQPISVDGFARVYRKSADPKVKESLLHEEPLTTDSHGRAYFRWKADRSGRFRVSFVTHDIGRSDHGSEVKGSLELWVDGPELARGRFLRQELFMAVKDPYYTEGQTAHVLLVTPAPGCTVLLTREADSVLLEKRLVHIEGLSQEVEIPLAHRDVPNVYLNAILIRDGQALTAQLEIFVPPARQFAELSVTADKERYQPGEKATFRLAAKDWQGRPLRTELSVSVSDASLTYIQKSYAPDIRAFLYGDRRSVATESLHSLDTRFDNAVEDRQKEVRYERHIWTMPEGMGMLEEWPGEQAGFGGRGRHAIYESRTVLFADFNGAAKSTTASLPEATELPMSTGTVVVSRRAQAYLAPMGTPSGGYSRGVGLIVDGGFMGDKIRGPQGERGAGGELLAPASMRSKFADTAFWTPAVITDADGMATVQVTWPDNLTQWRAGTVGITTSAQVGTAETTVRTKKDLLVRLQTPRFFVERDQVMLTANVQSDLPDAAKVRVKLELTGDAAEPVGEQAERWLEIGPHAEGRVDWTLHARKPGQVKVRMSVQCEKAADATETIVPVLVHGVERMVTQTGVLRGGTAQVRIELPEARKPGSSELIVLVNPSVATVALDALPYLADYPYGCVEQTLSRFVPAVIVAKTLRETGYDLKELSERARRTALQRRLGAGSIAGTYSPYTYPQGMPLGFQPPINPDNPRFRNPVFDDRELRDMIKEGLKKLVDWQHADGGWGWWQDDASDPYMTAYVAQGLQLARKAGVDFDATIITRGLDFLQRTAPKSLDLHLLAFAARVLAMEAERAPAVRPLAAKLFDRRERLSAYGKALLATALAAIGEKQKAGVVLRNIESLAQVDAANGTASWEDVDRCWWRWYNNRVETHAAILEAYLAAAQKDRMVPMVVKWLVNNRRGNSWSSTKETALAVQALVAYARQNRELAADYSVTVDLGGRVQRKFDIDRRSALLGDCLFVVPDAMLRTGAQTLKLTMSGQGVLYWAASTRYFSQEEPIPATSHEVAVTRRYYRLIPGTARGAPEVKPIDRHRANPFLTGRYQDLDVGGEWVQGGDTDGGPRYERKLLEEGAPVESGDLIEVELALEAKNDYEYVLFEDMKPSGCEPVELRSGGKAGIGAYSNMELRDQKVAFFLSSLPQGARLLSYRLRAETPGKFHVLPTNGYAMYAPEVRTLSKERSLEVRDTSR